MLGFFDVLGFSGLLTALGPEQLSDSYDRLIATAIAVEPMRCLNIRWIDESHGVPVLFALPDHHAYFSDTILLWAELRQEFVSPFLSRCADFMCATLEEGLPVRGAIALGKAIMDSQAGVFIGEPIVEGARVESAIGWAGCTFAESCAWPPFFPVVDPKLVLEYDAPAKHTSVSLLPVHLDWPRRWRDTRPTDLLDYLRQLNARRPHVYLEEAIKFAEHSLVQNDWVERPPAANAKFRMTAIRDLPPGTRPGT